MKHIHLLSHCGAVDVLFEDEVEKINSYFNLASSKTFESDRFPALVKMLEEQLTITL